VTFPAFSEHEWGHHQHTALARSIATRTLRMHDGAPVAV